MQQCVEMGFSQVQLAGSLLSLMNYHNSELVIKRWGWVLVEEWAQHRFLLHRRWDDTTRRVLPYVGSSLRVESPASRTLRNKPLFSFYFIFSFLITQSSLFWIWYHQTACNILSQGNWDQLRIFLHCHPLALYLFCVVVLQLSTFNVVLEYCKDYLTFGIIVFGFSSGKSA